jgi:hypothetical protein
MKRAFRDRTGERYGRLLILAHAGTIPGSCSVWLCECECGGRLVVRLSGLLGRTRSCGCLQRQRGQERGRANRTHGEGKGTPEYRAWLGMKSRCLNTSDRGFVDYGRRGIEVWEPWINDYPGFLAYIGRKPSPKHSLDRIDNDGNYEPGNIRWATPAQQNNNRRKPSETTITRRKRASS